MAINKKIISYIPNFLTLCSVASATTGILVLFPHPSVIDIAIAVFCLSCSLLLDRLDGVVARKLGVTSAIGAELDSLADLVAFGVLPVVLLKSTLLSQMPLLLGHSLSVLYVTSAALRLARFSQLGIMTHPKWGECFVGVPTIAAGAFLCCLVVVGQFYLISTTMASLMILLLTILMNSPFPYPKNGWGAWLWIVLIPIVLVVMWKKALVL